MNKIRTIEETKEIGNTISSSLKEKYRGDIIERSNDTNMEESQTQLAIPTHRKNKRISLDEYVSLIKNGESSSDISKKVSKHQVSFFNYILKNKEIISKEEFENLYISGISLEEISKTKNIPREYITFLRDFYGIKRKGAKYQKRLEEEQPLSQEAKDVIIGSILGDGSITKGNYFSEKHSEKQEQYLKWKASFMTPILTDKSLRYCEYIDKRSGTLIKEHSLITKTHVFLYEMREMFYKEKDGIIKKCVPAEIEQYLNKTIFSILFMDDGSTDWGYRNGIKEYQNSKPSCKISSQSFTKEDNEILQRAIKNKFGIDSEIRQRMSKHGSVLYYIIFNVENSEKLIRILKPFSQPELMYKFDEEKYIEYMNAKRSLPK